MVVHADAENVLGVSGAAFPSVALNAYSTSSTRPEIPSLSNSYEMGWLIREATHLVGKTPLAYAAAGLPVVVQRASFH